MILRITSECGTCFTLKFSISNLHFTLSQLSTDFAADREAIWIDGTIHANEWIAPATMLNFLVEIINRYRYPSSTDTGILYYCPCHYAQLPGRDHQQIQVSSITVPATMLNFLVEIINRHRCPLLLSLTPCSTSWWRSSTDTGILHYCPCHHAQLPAGDHQQITGIWSRE